ncbi:MAG: recombinase family protein [Oscillospiraceae bacterium]|nr:recombinase family protein [Oscillospiraceae bacterium]
MVREMSLDKLYVDKTDENIALKQLVAYSRRGDTVVVIDIRDFSNSAGGFFDILADFAKQGVNIYCSAQGIDTATFEWAAIMKVLRI